MFSEGSRGVATLPYLRVSRLGTILLTLGLGPATSVFMSLGLS